MLILGENPSGTLQKISEIYDRVAFAGVGKYNEFEQLRIGGIRRADLTGYSYSREDVTAKSLANAYAQTLGQIFTQDVKPYEVEIMVVEVGDDPADDHIFRITYDGTLYDERRFSAIGGAAEALMTHLAASHQEGRRWRLPSGGQRQPALQWSTRTGRSAGRLRSWNAPSGDGLSGACRQTQSPESALNHHAGRARRLPRLARTPPITARPDHTSFTWS